MTFHDTLKDSIAAEHDATEKVFQPSLFSEAFSAEDYKRYLLSNYLFFKAHEMRVAEVELPSTVHHLLHPSRADMLREDLHDLSIKGPLPDPPLRELSHQGSQHTAEASALGHVYVLAGSAMGARMISKHLLEKPFMTQGVADRFLQSYDRFDGRSWNAFKETLNQIDAPDRQQATIQAARTSFALFAQCYRQATHFLDHQNA
ncbi:biliverdin-producing heme oxygenase [Roseivirga sp. BDSF3-8]|uniref:biliverdin-producing heme oxygenase n=1 Tax=Roseivirga sp. BDSF3-8 TaxID=3241598 RepID=UPI0035324FDA